MYTLRNIFIHGKVHNELFSYVIYLISRYTSNIVILYHFIFDYNLFQSYNYPPFFYFSSEISRCHSKDTHHYVVNILSRGQIY